MTHFILILIGLVALTGYTHGNPLSDYFNSKSGTTAYKNENYDEAFSHFSTVIDSNKENGIAYSNLGNIYFKQQKFDEAIGAYDAASQLLQSTDAQFHLAYNKGTVALSQEDYSNAITHLKRALILNPTHQNAKYNLELALAKQNQSSPTSNAQNNPDSSTPNETPPPETENDSSSQSDNTTQDPSNTQDRQPESGQPSDSDKEKASQLLDQLSQLEKEARNRYKKAPPESIIVEFDW